MRRWMMLWAVLLLAAAMVCALAAKKDAAPEARTAADMGLLLLEQDGALMVLAVSEGSPAEAAGFAPGDWIMAAGGRNVVTVEELEEALAAQPPVGVRVRRVGGEERAVFWGD